MGNRVCWTDCYSKTSCSLRPVSAMFVAGGLIFAGIIGGEFLIGAYLKSVALNEIHPQLSADIGSLTVNGTQFGKADDLIKPPSETYATRRPIIPTRRQSTGCS